MTENKNYIDIKLGEQSTRLFKSLSNRRLIEQGETYDEYKLRQKINSQMIKKQNQWGYSK